MLSKPFHMKAATVFFQLAAATMGCHNELVTTDGHASYPERSTPRWGKRSTPNQCLSEHRLEQDHGSINGVIRCMCGFKSHAAAERFCREHGELRNFHVRATVTTKSSPHPFLVPYRQRRPRRLPHLPKHSWSFIPRWHAAATLEGTVCLVIRSRQSSVASPQERSPFLPNGSFGSKLGCTIRAIIHSMAACRPCPSNRPT